ncbi:uncharacterized protein LOC143305801 [Osmia lignaria lignaria]|uniref:uncharacterized protein LOC143305801 n=1 Tax=Osmia lignaria lignaria TaxID=1437193 RepID=UPI00402B4037
MCFFSFLNIDNLTNLIADQETNYKRLLKNENIRSIRTRTNKAKDKKIITSQENLMSGTLPLGQFLRFFSEDHKQEHYENDLMSTDPNENDKCNELLPKTTFFAEKVPTATVDECNEFPKITFVTEAANIASVNKFYKNQPTQFNATSNIEDHSGVMLAEDRVRTQNVHAITADGENKNWQKPVSSIETRSSNMSPQVVLEKMCIQTQRRKSLRKTTST